MIFVEYLQFWSILFWVEKGIKKKKPQTQNHRIWEMEGIIQKKKRNKIYGLFLFSTQHKNSFIEFQGKNVLAYHIYCLLHWLEESQWANCYGL